MPDFKNWIEQVKTDDSSLASFVTKLDRFFASNGFDSAGFEKAVNSGLTDTEKRITESFIKKEDVKSQ